LWDEARIFTGNKEFMNGVKAPQIKGKMANELFFDKDKLTVLINK